MKERSDHSSVQEQLRRDLLRNSNVLNRFVVGYEQKKKLKEKREAERVGTDQELSVTKRKQRRHRKRKRHNLNREAKKKQDAGEKKRRY